MKKLLMLPCFLLFISFIMGQTTDPRLKNIEVELNKVLETWQAAGFAVAVVEKDKIIYAKGFGYADYEKKVKADANTLFAIGSCTKAFTSSLLGLLRDEKKLDFNDSPRKYIPELKFFNEEMNNFISIKDMMCHRTGLPRHDFSWYLFPTEDKDSLIQRIVYQEPFTGVREQWYYNNFMFLTQGVIAERLSGKSWEENVQEKLFNALEMKRSNLSIEALEKSENVAFGYEVKKEAIKKMDYYHIRAMSPAGSINSSVNEMSNWVITWINGGKYKGKDILPANYVQEAMSSQMVVSGGVPDKENPDLHMGTYGYGWFLSSYRGHYRVEHGGNIDGFSANTSFFPSDSIGIVVLVNQNGSPIPSLVRNIVADKMLKLSNIDWSGNAKAKSDKAKQAQEEGKTANLSNQKKGTKPSHLLEAYAGDYAHPGYGSFKLSVQHDSLFAQLPLVKNWLKHYHYDVFQPFEVTETGINTEDESPIRFNFSTNNVGEIDGFFIQIEPTIEPVFFKRAPSIVAMETASLDKYVGEYALGEMVAKIYVKEGTTFHLFVPGQPEYNLLALGDHKFAIKELDGFKLEFVEGEKGKVNELIFHQPNGVFKAIRKE